MQEELRMRGKTLKHQTIMFKPNHKKWVRNVRKWQRAGEPPEYECSIRGGTATLTPSETEPNTWYVKRMVF